MLKNRLTTHMMAPTKHHNRRNYYIDIFFPKDSEDYLEKPQFIRRWMNSNCPYCERRFVEGSFTMYKCYNLIKDSIYQSDPDVVNNYIMTMIDRFLHNDDYVTMCWLCREERLEQLQYNESQLCIDDPDICEYINQEEYCDFLDERNNLLKKNE